MRPMWSRLPSMADLPITLSAASIVWEIQREIADKTKSGGTMRADISDRCNNSGPWGILLPPKSTQQRRLYPMKFPPCASDGGETDVLGAFRVLPYLVSPYSRHSRSYRVKNNVTGRRVGSRCLFFGGWSITGSVLYGKARSAIG